MEQSKEARVYYILGSVQGVGYRYFAQGVAVRLGLAGYVKNLQDGRVEAYAIGTSLQLAEFRHELERGPRAATVLEVIEEESRIEERFAGDFSIEHDSW
ncbi:MAG TPA: acylphosphatase [Candidatus Acidoferrales bacterium]|nr:acylphosphatase [Candidatus Acidoferrales bacterium]